MSRPRKTKLDYSTEPDYSMYYSDERGKYAFEKQLSYCSDNRDKQVFLDNVMWYKNKYANMESLNSKEQKELNMIYLICTTCRPSDCVGQILNELERNTEIFNETFFNIVLNLSGLDREYALTRERLRCNPCLYPIIDALIDVNYVGYEKAFEDIIIKCQSIDLGEKFGKYNAYNNAPQILTDEDVRRLNEINRMLSICARMSNDSSNYEDINIDVNDIWATLKYNSDYFKKDFEAFDSLKSKDKTFVETLVESKSFNDPLLVPIIDAFIKAEYVGAYEAFADIRKEYYENTYSK